VRVKLLIIFVVAAQLCAGQGTWYGEISLLAGGGVNDIFRFREPEGAESFTGKGMWTTGVDLRRLFGDHFSLGTGITYSHQYYYSSSGSGIPGEDIHGDFGVIGVPVTARVDFLKWLFADAGVIASLQTGSSLADNMSGAGIFIGAGFQYNFRSDLFIRVRAYASQHALQHFVSDDYPQTLWNTGMTVGFGYRFIHLGKCNCPGSNAPRRRFF
jgi:hypothetical protein